MIPNDKDRQPAGANPTPAPAAAGSPEDGQRARNENPRANENLPQEKSANEGAATDVGSEITDGEDA